MIKDCGPSSTHTPRTAVLCDCFEKPECKAEHQEEADVVFLQRFYIVLEEAECSDGNKQKAFFFKCKSAAASGKQYKKKTKTNKKPLLSGCKNKAKNPLTPVVYMDYHQ